jgi:16S rRNA (cytidine1402-2'-O)-methyltransferase
MSGILFVVATPIGNLEDLTPRARQTLAEVSLIAAEDTRHSGRLLMHIGCKTRLMALHDHNEEKVVHRLIETLQGGDNVALVSDAGTPLVSDPGFRLVRAAHEHGITVSPIPGASAVTAALSAAGIPTDRFCFEGFAPAKRAARVDWLENLVDQRRTLIIYESVHRIGDCLADMVAVFGAERRAFIGR